MSRKAKEAAQGLLARRDEVLAGCQQAEKTPGSGWHLRDLGAERRDGEPALSERVVVLQQDDQVHVVGPCVAKVQDGCAQFLAKLGKARSKAAEKGWPEPDLLGHGQRYQAVAEKHCKDVGTAGDCLCLPCQVWNYVNSVLGYLGILCTLSDAEVVDYSDC